jgi:hypothetical protein
VCVFLAVDHFTKFAWGRALREKSAATLHATLQALLDALPRPKFDLAGEFRNALVRSLL